jgi:hypothetical protein
MKEQITDYSDDNKKFINIIVGQNANTLGIKENCLYLRMGLERLS